MFVHYQCEKYDLENENPLVFFWTVEHTISVLEKFIAWCAQQPLQPSTVSFLLRQPGLVKMFMYTPMYTLY